MGVATGVVCVEDADTTGKKKTKKNSQKLHIVSITPALEQHLKLLIITNLLLARVYSVRRQAQIN